MNPVLNISFGRSSSHQFARVIRLAESLPGYCVQQQDRHISYHVRVEVCLDDTVWDKVEQLIRLIGGWRSTSMNLDGRAVKSWRLLRSLAAIKACYAQKLKHGVGEHYCSGKNSPTSEATFFGCRLCRGVARERRAFSRRGELWTEYGTLSAELDAFHVDKEAILKIVEPSARDEACVLCPAFRWQRLRADVEDLPDSLKLDNDSLYEVRYSQISPGRALGIKRKQEDVAHKPFLYLSMEDLMPSAVEVVAQRCVPKVRYADVAGQDKAQAAMRQIVQLPLLHGEYFAALNVEPQAGVLLYGPPGNGKTLLAKAAATECQAHLEIINGPEILSKWVGQSEANLRQVFNRCRDFAPSVLLIDEIDSLAPCREWLSQQHNVQLVSQLLVLLDGLEARGRIAVVATTNRIEAIDAALRRPGRFDYHIEVPPPNRQGRAAILHVHLKKMRLANGVRIEPLVKATAGFSGAELAGLCREAGIQAIQRGLAEGTEPSEVRLTEGDLCAALKTWRARRTRQL